MKKIIAFSFISCIAIPAIKGQKTDTSANYKVYADMLFQKPKFEKKTGWLLLAGSVGIAVIGGIVQSSQPGGGQDFNVDVTGTMISVGGRSLGLASIPFFIASGSNRSRAEVLLKNEKLDSFKMLDITQISVGVAINF
jgi:hypothetical protein